MQMAIGALKSEEPTSEAGSRDRVASRDTTYTSSPRGPVGSRSHPPPVAHTGRLLRRKARRTLAGQLGVNKAARGA